MALILATNQPNEVLKLHSKVVLGKNGSIYKDKILIEAKSSLFYVVARCPQVHERQC